MLSFYFLVGGSAGNIKAKFENLAVANEEENKKRVEEEKARRKAKEERDRKEAQRKQQVGQMSSFHFVYRLIEFNFLRIYFNNFLNKTLIFYT